MINGSVQASCNAEKGCYSLSEFPPSEREKWKVPPADELLSALWQDKINCSKLTQGNGPKKRVYSDECAKNHLQD